jgi:adenosine deaminase
VVEGHFADPRRPAHPGTRPRRSRTLTEQQNQIIVEKAIRYAPRGIVGIDIAGPRSNSDDPYPLPDTAPARPAGARRRPRGDDPRRRGGRRLRDRRDPRSVSTLRPDRIGHGILAARDKGLMGQISEAGIVLEICPTSNLLTKALESEDALRDTFRALADCGRAVHDRNGRPGDDAHAPARRVRAAAADQRSTSHG